MPAYSSHVRFDTTCLIESLKIVCIERVMFSITGAVQTNHRKHVSWTYGILISWGISSNFSKSCRFSLNTTFWMSQTSTGTAMCQKNVFLVIKDAQYIGDHIIVGKCVFHTVQCSTKKKQKTNFNYVSSCKQYHTSMSAVIDSVNPGVVGNHGLSAWRVLILKGCNM